MSSLRSINSPPLQFGLLGSLSPHAFPQKPSYIAETKASHTESAPKKWVRLVNSIVPVPDRLFHQLSAGDMSSFRPINSPLPQCGFLGSLSPHAYPQESPYLAETTQGLT